MLKDWNQEQDKDIYSQHFYSILEVLATAVRQEKEKERNSDWKRSGNSDLPVTWSCI